MSKALSGQTKPKFKAPAPKKDGKSVEKVTELIERLKLEQDMGSSPREAITL